MIIPLPHLRYSSDFLFFFFWTKIFGGIFSHPLHDNPNDHHITNMTIKYVIHMDNYLRGCRVDLKEFYSKPVRRKILPFSFWIFSSICMPVFFFPFFIGWEGGWGMFHLENKMQAKQSFLGALPQPILIFNELGLKLWTWNQSVLSFF